MSTISVTFATLLPQSNFARRVIVLAAGTVVGQLVVFLASPILTRLYSPQDFGVFAVYASLLSVLSVVAAMRYELAIPLPGDEQDASALVGLGLAVCVSMGVVMEVAVWFGADRLMQVVNVPGLRPHLWLLPIAVTLVGAYQTFNYWAVRRGAFSRIARTKLMQDLASVSVQLALGAFGVGPLGLLVGDIAGRIAGLSVLSREGWRAFWCVSVRDIRDVATRYKRFPLLSVWAAMLNVVSLQLPVLLLARFFGTYVAGHYALSYRVLGLPAMLVGQAVGQVFFSAAAFLKNDSAALGRLTERTAISLFYVGLPVFTALLFNGRRVFAFLFGQEWATAGVYAQIMAPWFFLWIVSSPLSQLLTVREWQGASLGFTVIELTLRFVSVYVGAILGHPWLSIALLAISGVAVSTAAILWFFRAGYAQPIRVIHHAARIVVLTALFVPLLIMPWLGAVHPLLPVTLFMLACYATASPYLLRRLL